MPNASRIIILDSQSIILAFDPDHDDAQLLQLAYQLIKINTQSRSGELDEVNIVEVRKSLHDALKALEKFDNLTKSAASAIENSASSIKKDALAIRTIISDRLGSAQAAMLLEANLEELERPEPPSLTE